MTVTQGTCKYGKWLQTLDNEDTHALTHYTHTTKSVAQLHATLTKANYGVSLTTTKTHVRGLCGCPTEGT